MALDYVGGYDVPGAVVVSGVPLPDDLVDIATRATLWAYERLIAPVGAVADIAGTPFPTATASSNKMSVPRGLPPDIMAAT